MICLTDITASIKKGWHFIFLDSASRVKDNHSYPARLDKEQMEWLENDLKKTPAKTPICVVSHIPIISTSVFFDGDNEKSGNWNVPGAWMHLDARKIKDLFADYPNFDFTRFYESLHQRGQVIYQGKLSDTNCFRIGNIGQLYLEDIENLLTVIKEVMEEMGIIVPDLTVP